MPVKWSPLKVSGAMDKVEEHINQAIGPLEQARAAAREALNIPNLPQYVTQHIQRIIGDIDQAIGGNQWNPTGRLKSDINSVRDSLPKSELEDERKRADMGDQLNMMN